MKGICIMTIMLLMPLFSYADVDFEIKTDCSSEKMIKRRLDVKGENLELCAVSAKDAEEESYAVSLISPWFGFGHLRTRGLFTESMNPCGYSPASEVFFEPCRLVLDRSIGEAGTYGIFVSPAPWLVCFSLGTKEEQYIRGFMSSFSKEDFAVYLLMEHSDIREYSSESSWYLSRGEETGSRELWNLLVNCIYEKEWFLFSATAGTAFGDYVENGFFNRDYITFFYKNYFELNFMFAGTTEQYLAPGGSIPSSQYKYGADVWIRPFRPLKLSGVWYTDYKRPDEKDQLYNDFARHLTLKSVFDLWDFTFSATYAADTLFSNTSETTEKRQYTGSIVYSNDLIRLSFANHWYIEDDSFYRDSFTLSCRLYFEYFQANITWKRDIQEGITDSFSEDLILKLDYVRLTLSHKKEGDKSSVFSFTGIINY